LGPPGCGTRSLAIGNAASSNSFIWARNASQSSFNFYKDL
jgi:hypothetical protein